MDDGFPEVPEKIETLFEKKWNDEISGGKEGERQTEEKSWIIGEKERAR